MKVQKLNKWQACWILYLSRFDFTLKHILGTKMGKMNRLSRRLDSNMGVEKNNKNQTIIKKQWICSLAKVVIEGSEVEMLKK